MLGITPQERLALGVTALLLSLGAGVRVLGTEPPPPEFSSEGGAADTSGSSPLAELRGRVAERTAAAERAATPLAAGERIDPNRAPATELDRLPRVGPALAARIVAHREAHGPFRSLADLDAVPGVGPALLTSLAPLVELPAASGAPSGSRAAALDVNRATAAELEALPGVGPALAARIVEHRQRHGPFRSADELERVPGIGPVLRARIAPRVRIGP